jgi:hypothetical protein
MRRTPLVPVLLVSALAALALGACDRQSEPAASPTEAPASAASTATATATIAAPAPAAIDRTPTFKGYGELAFGKNSKELREIWKGPLEIAPPAAGSSCQQVALDPAAPKALKLMIEGDKLVRYDVATDAETAPGGGKVGMGIDQIRKLYDGRVREQPAKYVPGGVDLRVSADDDSGSALIFETGADGKVTAWRVGQSPAIDYTEGCS